MYICAHQKTLVEEDILSCNQVLFRTLFHDIFHRIICVVDAICVEIYR